MSFFRTSHSLTSTSVHPSGRRYLRLDGHGYCGVISWCDGRKSQSGWGGHWFRVCTAARETRFTSSPVFGPVLPASEFMSLPLFIFMLHKCQIASDARGRKDQDCSGSSSGVRPMSWRETASTPITPSKDHETTPQHPMSYSIPFEA